MDHPGKNETWRNRATLTRCVAASLQLDGVSGKLSHGSSIRTGRYQLEEGLIQINFESGVEVVIEAPASFEIHSSDFVRLSDGQLAANVPRKVSGSLLILQMLKWSIMEPNLPSRS